MGLFKIHIFYLMYMSVCMHVCVHVHALPVETKKRALAPVELAMNHHMGAGLSTRAASVPY